MSFISRGRPLTHGVESARRLADGASLSTVSGLIGAEAPVGAVYGLLGYGFLRFMEWQGRRFATLETA